MAEKEGFEPSRPFAEPTPLAGEPLTATWVLLQLNILLKNWRRERDSNPRYLAVSLVFKTSSLNHSDISPRSQRYDYNRTSAACQQQKRQKWIYIIFLSLPCSSPSCSPPHRHASTRQKKQLRTIKQLPQVNEPFLNAPSGRQGYSGFIVRYSDEIKFTLL